MGLCSVAARAVCIFGDIDSGTTGSLEYRRLAVRLIVRLTIGGAFGIVLAVAGAGVCGHSRLAAILRR